MTTFPPELVEIIVYEAWHSEMPSYIRKSFMTTCPQINRTWKAVYAPITSRDIYITNLAYIYYLCDIARLRKSIIYHDFIPRLTRSITCFINLQEELHAMEIAVKKAYHYLLGLPNDIGFKTLFPLVPYISFVLRWSTDGRRNLDIPIRVCYRRYLSKITERGRTRMDVYVSVVDSDPSPRIHESTLVSAGVTLSQIGVPGTVLTFLTTCENGCLILDGVRYFSQIMSGHPPAQGDIGDINRCLWMASKGHPRLGCLTTFFNNLEYKRVQRSLPLAHYDIKQCYRKSLCEHW
ncbi:hypothetical protein ARMSODRAFT_1010899 [Armillaria solidipes]|uniref:Uncharacterized protein n=1 Tax=Armillaria solidipes TaxID=1076256 RepID=A0A2H3C5G0_9AGAR|nr:hypothetical protein ARMSODRAFT_1010899 [Armillaria solidipes]